MLKNGVCRRSGRSINGSANAMTNTFDALGMLSSMTTGIGHSPTPTIPRGDCSNCQPFQGETANYTYYGVNEDLRLNTLQRKLGTTEILSRNTPMRITAICSSASCAPWGSPGQTLSYSYDNADQL